MDKTKWPYKSKLPVAVPGLKFIFAALIITVIFLLVGWSIIGGISFFITCFILWFFRDPERVVPDDPNSVVSPADGKIIIIDKNSNNSFNGGNCIKISIFMNVFNVHVNRIPFKGIVEKVIYIPGKFLNASFDKASEHNERNALVLKTESGSIYTVVQIAGLIARRIVCKINEGELIDKGVRYGMICFGSRLDIYLPLDADIKIKLGQKVQAGSTILGCLK